ncbi:MAG: PilN domain-containing protein [Planctomycetes bacterium]|nr:PilN domain-containing protein [Planctomycetota bacterium]
MNSSFLPEDYVERRAQQRTNVLSLLLFVVVMGGVVGAFFVTDRQRAEVHTMQRNVNTRFEEAARRIDQLDQLQGRKEDMIRKAKVTSALLERIPRTLILSELINNMPQTLSLLDLNFTTRVVKPRVVAATALEKQRLEQAAEAAKKASPEPEMDTLEVEINLVGVATTDVQVAQFMTALGRSPMFGDLNLAYSEEITIEGAQLRTFRIDMRLNTEMDVRKLEPTMVKRELKHNPMAESVQFNNRGRITANPTASKPQDKPRATPINDR